MYSPNDEGRFILEDSLHSLDFEEYRTAYRRDYERIIHSPCFRRLIGRNITCSQGKNLIFSGTD